MFHPFEWTVKKQTNERFSLTVSNTILLASFAFVFRGFSILYLYPVSFKCTVFILKFVLIPITNFAFNNRDKIFLSLAKMISDFENCPVISVRSDDET